MLVSRDGSGGQTLYRVEVAPRRLRGEEALLRLPAGRSPLAWVGRQPLSICSRWSSLSTSVPPSIRASSLIAMTTSQFNTPSAAVRVVSLLERFDRSGERPGASRRRAAPPDQQPSLSADTSPCTERPSVRWSGPAKLDDVRQPEHT